MVIVRDTLEKKDMQRFFNVIAYDLFQASCKDDFQYQKSEKLCEVGISQNLVKDCFSSNLCPRQWCEIF